MVDFNPLIHKIKKDKEAKEEYVYLEIEKPLIKNPKLEEKELQEDIELIQL